MYDLTVYYPFLNNLQLSKLAWMTANQLTTLRNTDFVVLDNGSDENPGKWVSDYLGNERWSTIRIPKNGGMLESLRQVQQLCTSTIAGVVHCDSFILDYGWNDTVMEQFQCDSRIGIIALFGARVCHPDGIRGDCYTSLIDAGQHGKRIFMNQYCSVVDGFAMFYRMDLLKSLDIGLGYLEQGQYDYDMSLESLRKGYTNMMLAIPCTHLCGITAASGQWSQYLKEKYQREDAYQYVDQHNYELWKRKWSQYLPVKTDPTTGIVNWRKTPAKDNSTFQTFL